MTKRFMIFILLALVLVALGVALAFFTAQPNDLAVETKNLITQVESTLSQSQVEEVRAEVAELQARIAAGDKSGEPDFMLIYLTLAQKYELLGELGLARESLLKAAQENSGASLPHINLGVLYQRMEGLELARQAFEAAIVLEPAVVAAWEGLIDLEQNVFKADEAKLRDLFQRGLAATAKEPRLVHKYAVYLAKIGARVEAISVYEELLKAYPDDARLRSELEQLKGG